MFPAVEAWSPNHWTTREFLFLPHLISIYFIYLNSWVEQYYFIDSSPFLFKNLSVGLGFKSQAKESLVHNTFPLNFHILIGPFPNFSSQFQGK